jgi:hypothetical protein
LVGARPMNICEKDLNIDDLKSVSEEQNSQELCNAILKLSKNCVKKEL